MLRHISMGSSLWLYDLEEHLKYIIMFQQLNKSCLNCSLLYIKLSFHFVIFLLPFIPEILPPLEIVLLNVNKA